MREEPGMSVIVKRVTRITVSLIFLFGIYILLHGHLTPGGGFAGGVIMALSFIHVVLAFGREEAQKHLKESFILLLEPVGGLLFLGIALIGLTGGYFFLNVLPKGTPYRLFSSGIILPCNIAIFLKVGAGLFTSFIALTALKIDRDKNKEK